MYNFKLHWTITYFSFCYEIPVFDSLVSISMGIASFQEQKLLQQLQKLKGLSQWIRKRKKHDNLESLHKLKLLKSLHKSWW